MRLSYNVKRLQKKPVRARDRYLVRQGRNYSVEASGSAIKGLLLVLGHSEVVENEMADKLPNSRTRGIRATSFSVSLPKSCLEKLLGK